MLDTQSSLYFSHYSTPFSYYPKTFHNLSLLLTLIHMHYYDTFIILVIQQYYCLRSFFLVNNFTYKNLWWSFFSRLGIRGKNWIFSMRLCRCLIWRVFRILRLRLWMSRWLGPGIRRLGWNGFVMRSICWNACGDRCLGGRWSFFFIVAVYYL